MEAAGRWEKVWFSWRKCQFCSVGVGKPLSPERCRMLLALRINVLAKGYSGISLETLKQVIEVFNGKAMNPQTGLS
jgi:histidine ammonia-lyase